jgi:hypothetical protein
MVAAWYMDNVDSDQKESHKTDPPVMVEIGDLHKIGVEYCKVHIYLFIITFLFS